MLVMSPSVVLDHESPHDDIKSNPYYKDGLKGDRNTSTVLHRSLLKEPLQVTFSKGNYLHLSNGQEILDATGGAAVSCLGHGNERVQKALVDQMRRVSYCHSSFYGTDAAEDLARFLIGSTNGEMERAFFISSGSEAMEAALKLARQYHLEKEPPEPQRTHFIARQQSYHGTTLGALSVGGHVARRALFEPMLSMRSARVSPCYAYRGMEQTCDDAEFQAAQASYLDRLEAELDSEIRRLGPENVAAFVAEPVVGAALGCVPPIPGYFQAVRRVCDRYGVLLIFDEVMCGAGRIAPEPSTRHPQPLHAWQDPLIDVVPDIMTLGKGLGGGFVPVAAMMAHRKVISVLQRGSNVFSHGQTYQGHPLSCRAALEVQRIIRDNGLIANAREQGKLLESLLRQQLNGHPSVGDIRGKGLFWGIEFVADIETKRAYPPSMNVATGIHDLGLREPYNISLYPGNGSVNGREGDHILLAPAYNATSADIHEIVRRVVAVIEQFFASMEEV